MTSTSGIRPGIKEKARRSIFQVTAMRGPRGEVGTPSRGRGKRVISLAGRGGQNSATGKEATCTKEARNCTKGKGQMGTKEQRAAHTKSRHYITGVENRPRSEAVYHRITGFGDRGTGGKHQCTSYV